MSNLRLCSANHREDYFSNLACDWLCIVWAYPEQETENGPWSVFIECRPTVPLLKRTKYMSQSKSMQHGSDVTRALWRLKSPATRLIVEDNITIKTQESSTLLGLCKGITRSPVVSMHKGPETLKAFPCPDLIMAIRWCHDDVIKWKHFSA